MDSIEFSIFSIAKLFCSCLFLFTAISESTFALSLSNLNFSDLTISQISSGSFSGDVQIKDTSSGKILFLLEDKDIGLIDSDDFIVTDFV